MRLVRLTQKNGVVAAIRHVHEDDEILIVTEGGMLIRMNANEIRQIGRATQGVRVIRLDESDRVVSVARAAANDVSDEGNGADAIEDSLDDAADE